MIDHTLWQTVVDQLIQVSLVAGIGTLIAARCVRLRPHLAYVVLLLVLVKCVTPPVIPGPIPWWSTSASKSQTTFTIASDSALPAAAPSIPVEPRNEFTSPSHGVAGNVKTVASPDTTRKSVWFAMLLIWAIGACGTLLVSAIRFFFAQRRWHSSRLPLADDLQESCDRLASQLGVRRKTEVSVNTAEYGPLVSGWLRPTIVLPQCLFKDGDRHDLELAIAHELVHIRRGDTFLSALQVAVNAIWWFHPFVWWANRVMDRTCEQCCDEEVIASLQCKPSRYARLLVAVMERKQHLRHVMALPGAQPNNITAARLARLGKPASTFRSRTPWLYRVFALLMAVMLLPGKQLVGRPQMDDHEPKASATESAEALFRKKDWDAAAEAYQQIVEQKPNNAIAWSRLGYVLHATGRLEEALKCHRRAAEFDATRAVGLYNVACAEALLGNLDRALEALEAAVDAGYRAPAGVLAKDSDLESLHGREEFQAIAERAADVSTMRRYRELDFMIGQWHIHDDQGAYRGRAEITSDEKGFLITEKWEDANGTTGTGISYYDPKLGAWRQTFVGMFGNIAHTNGNFAGNTLSVSGESIMPNGNIAKTKSSTTLHEDGSFTFLMENSRDEGESWQAAFFGRYTPAPEADQHP